MIPPKRMAPPTPPTTPPIIFLELSLKPEGEPLSSPFRPGVLVMVAKPVVDAMTRLDVTTEEMVEPPLTVTNVVVKNCVDDDTRGEVWVVRDGVERVAVGLVRDVGSSFLVVVSVELDWVSGGGGELLVTVGGCEFPLSVELVVRWVGVAEGVGLLVGVWETVAGGGGLDAPVTELPVPAACRFSMKPRSRSIAAVSWRTASTASKLRAAKSIVGDGRERADKRRGAERGESGAQ